MASTLVELDLEANTGDNVWQPINAQIYREHASHGWMAGAYLLPLTHFLIGFCSGRIILPFAFDGDVHLFPRINFT
jgi:hypothetical protein